LWKVACPQSSFHVPCDRYGLWVQTGENRSAEKKGSPKAQWFLGKSVHVEEKRHHPIHEFKNGMYTHMAAKSFMQGAQPHTSGQGSTKGC
jgi:hypothetical protein